MILIRLLVWLCIFGLFTTLSVIVQSSFRGERTPRIFRRLGAAFAISLVLIVLGAYAITRDFH